MSEFSTKHPKKPLIIALTGGIASGKTAASDAFAALGVPVIDTDVIAREVVQPGSHGLAQVAETFGEELIAADGQLDRSQLRNLIFGDAEARARLESILHPLIGRQARDQLAAVTAPYAILVVPLLVETGMFRDADRVLVIDVPEQVQMERLMARDGMSKAGAERALRAQASREQRLAIADEVLDNLGSLSDLQHSVADLHRKYLALAEA